MKCPFCGFLDSQVKDSRLTEDGACIRRRELVVVKKNGDKERFDREKLELSLQLAVRKRPVAPERVEKIVTSIQPRLESSGETEISSRVIGEYAMEALAALDNVAYVRFASVYKDFCEVSDFEEFVAQIDEMAKPRDNKEKE